MDHKFLTSHVHPDEVFYPLNRADTYCNLVYTNDATNVPDLSQRKQAVSPTDFTDVNK